MPTKKPDFFIVGAPKCGTTTLHTYLGGHPQVFMPTMKEPCYFAGDTGVVIRDEAAYLDLFAPANGANRAGEASPWYLYSKEAASKIREFNPDSRIIVMIRQPAAFLYSLHNHQLGAMHGEDVVDFAEALAAEPDRVEGRRLPMGLELPPCYLYYRDVARFTPQIRRYIETFGPDRVHVILFDDFIGDPQGEFAKVCRFLEIRDDVPFEPTNANPARRLRSRALAHLMYRVPRPILAVGKLVPPSLRHWVRDSLVKMNQAKGYKARIDPELRRTLTIEFIPEIEALSKLIGRDLSAWCKA